MRTLRQPELPANSTAEDVVPAVQETTAPVLAIGERKPIHDERGMALYLVVALLIPVGLLWALFMDIGRLYVTRGQMQVAADAAALAAASGFIDGDPGGDAIQDRAAEYVAANPIGAVPAILESLSIDTDSGSVGLVLKYQTGPLLLAPAGITMRMGAKARATIPTAGETGRPIPHGNAFGWWKHEKINPAASDSGLVRLVS